MRDDLIATYRLQLHAQFGFTAAAEVVDYLAGLGVSHVYLSPILQAAAGSTHGYDVVDPTRLNADLGGRAGLDALIRSLRERGLGLVLDIVPNHMAISGPENPWWWDVLENGPGSRYAAFFDVDWEALESEGANKILLPVLGDHYGRVLEAGEIKLARQQAGFQVHYHEHRFPVAPRSQRPLLAAAAEACGCTQLAFIADMLGRLPSPWVRDTQLLEERHRDKEVLRSLLSDLIEREAGVATAVDGAIRDCNASHDALDGLLSAQHYRLAYWPMAGQELGYRRFFDINTLIGLRVEDPRVFAETHRLILHWLHDGMLDGLRIDHIDGLRNPEDYLRRLRRAAPGCWIVVEKILQRGEALPTEWPIDGTTGYDFMNLAGGLFIDPAAEPTLTGFYVAFTREPVDYPAMLVDKKRQVLRDVLGSDVSRLTALVREVCMRQRRHRDYTRAHIETAVREVAACFPVYRSYVQSGAAPARDEDIHSINAAVDAALQCNPDIDPELLQFLREILLLRIAGDIEVEVALRFQQLTGAAMAKGLEDTTFYCYNRLVGLNEVGGDPGCFGRSSGEFHAACAAAQKLWPRRMLASSTHDSKRGEDVRARLAVLSEVADRWCAAVRHWAQMNARHKTEEWPDRNAEYLLYQTLVGAWPLDAPRAVAYMHKAAREARQHTSWTHRNERYERSLQAFVEAVLADAVFTSELEKFVAGVAPAGWLNSLAQTLLKLTAPGIPDFYQGSEWVDRNLVDPDNRRPVDFDRLRRRLDEARRAGPEEVLHEADPGLAKLWLIQRVLEFRGQAPALFGEAGDYQPLAAAGPRADHVVSFLRGGGVITLVPRLTARLANPWEGTQLELPSGEWRNVLTGETHRGTRPLSALLARFPVALLAREAEAGDRPESE